MATSARNDEVEAQSTMTGQARIWIASPPARNDEVEAQSTMTGQARVWIASPAARNDEEEARSAEAIQNRPNGRFARGSAFTKKKAP